MNGIRSCVARLTSGVPQGSVLGPLLFILYINDLSACLNTNSCDAFVFADDIFLLFSADKGCETILENNINVCLNSILQWTSSNSLTINPLKTKAIRFTSNEMVINIFIGQTMVQFLDQHKCLGVIIDRRLNFGPHIDSVHARVYGILRRLYSTCFYFPKWIKFRIAYALLMPLVSYALEVISGTVYYNVLKLKCIVNSIIRYVYNIRRRDHVSPFVKQFLGLPFERYIDLRNLLFFTKLLKLVYPCLCAICLNLPVPLEIPRLFYQGFLTLNLRSLL